MFACVRPLFGMIVLVVALCTAPACVEAHSPMPPAGSTDNGFGTNLTTDDPR